MKQERIKNYNDHAIFMAEIAQAILQDNKGVLDINGVKEIIALYLMIPYMTPYTLETPDARCFIPKIQKEILSGITNKDLRDTLCHSFVTVEDKGSFLIIDDRAIEDREIHEGKGHHSTAQKVPIRDIYASLINITAQIIK